MGRHFVREVGLFLTGYNKTTIIPSKTMGNICYKIILCRIRSCRVEIDMI